MITVIKIYSDTRYRETQRSDQVSDSICSTNTMDRSVHGDLYRGSLQRSRLIEKALFDVTVTVLIHDVIFKDY